MTHRSPPSRTVRVDALSRVEGEGGLDVQIEDGRVSGVQLRIYEPPRFFEAFLRGRHHTEPPDITARICGICPVAYQMSACLAIEDACGVRVDGPLHELRRLLYFGEWIESHGLHVYLLHAPDFMGYPSAIDMAEDHPDLVRRGLAMKKVGNDLLELIGGRAVHPVNVRVGGFYRLPTAAELAPMRERLLVGLDAALETVAWVAGFDFPDLEHHHPYVALEQPDDYAVLGGRIRSTAGLDVPVADFDRAIEETQVPWSTALHAHLLDGDHYLVGPLARFALNRERLHPAALAAAATAGLTGPCRNPFQSIVVRAVELVHAFASAVDVIDAYERPDRPAVDVPARAGVGHGATEAPRGLLYHRYELADDGTILDARIVPPTSQNQSAIEHDLFDFIDDRLADHDDVALAAGIEALVRSYDPCISCATHFLDVRVDRTGSGAP